MSEQATAMGRWWTAKELAKAAGVSDAYIRRLLIDGKLQGEKRAFTWFIPDLVARRFVEQRGQR